MPGAAPPGFATFTTQVIGGKTVPVVVLTLEDGALGDDAGVDGVIVDVGGPSSSSTLVGKKLQIRADGYWISRRLGLCRALRSPIGGTI